MKKDQLKVRIEEAKGKIKGVVCNIMSDDEMELEGNIEKDFGKVKTGISDLKGNIKKTNKA